MHVQTILIWKLLLVEIFKIFKCIQLQNLHVVETTNLECPMSPTSPPLAFRNPSRVSKCLPALFICTAAIAVRTWFSDTAKLLSLDDLDCSSLLFCTLMASRWTGSFFKWLIIKFLNVYHAWLWPLFKLSSRGLFISSPVARVPPNKDPSLMELPRYLAQTIHCMAVLCKFFSKMNVLKSLPRAQPF